MLEVCSLEKNVLFEESSGYCLSYLIRTGNTGANRKVDDFLL